MYYITTFLCIARIHQKKKTGEIAKKQQIYKAFSKSSLEWREGGIDFFQPYRSANK